MVSSLSLETQATRAVENRREVPLSAAHEWPADTVSAWRTFTTTTSSACGAKTSTTRMAVTGLFEVVFLAEL